MNKSESSLPLPRPDAARSSKRRRWPRLLVLAFASLIVIALNLWAAAALFVDFPVPAMRIPATILYAAAILAALIVIRRKTIALAACAAGFLIVLTWWLLIPPSNSRDWQSDVASEPWAEIQGDRVILHNVRNCNYRTENDYDAVFEDREYDLGRLRTLDLFFVNWGSPNIAHTMLSFGFDDGRYLCASIEARKEKGEAYSALLGFFRRFELVYIFADERDLVRLRTNYRQGENVYLYRLHTRPGGPRAIFEEYLRQANVLHQRPRWYNAATTNCTTNVFHNVAVARRSAIPWDRRMLINGRLDEMMIERGSIVTDLTLTTLREQSLINPIARSLSPDADFSAEIRRNLPTDPGVANIP